MFVMVQEGVAYGFAPQFFFFQVTHLGLSMKMFVPFWDGQLVDGEEMFTATKCVLD